MLCYGSEDTSALEARRAKYSASVLEFEVVLSLLETLAHSSLGRRALRDLGPRSQDGARAALARVREMQEFEKHGGGPSFAGVTDQFKSCGSISILQRTLRCAFSDSFQSV